MSYDRDEAPADFGRFMHDRIRAWMEALIEAKGPEHVLERAAALRAWGLSDDEEQDPMLPITIASLEEFDTTFGRPIPLDYPGPPTPDTTRGAPKAWSPQIERAIATRPRGDGR